MNHLHQFFVAVTLCFVSLVTFGCSTSNSKGGDERPGSGLPAITAVMGHVLDVDGQGLQGVTVSGGGAKTTTAADGSFQLDVAPGPLVVTVDKDGYVHGVKRVDVQNKTPTALRFTMVKEAPAIALDSDQGGSVEGDRGAAIEAPAGVFVDANGKSVTGEVQVHLTLLDPSVQAQLEAYPGDLAARKKDGSNVQLQTYGVLDVTVRQGGKKLQIADSKSIEVKIPAPAALASAPPEKVGLWSFDESTGVWVEEGELTYNAEEKVYEGAIPHMSPWNADKVQDSTCIHGTVTDENGNPLPGARVAGILMGEFGGSEATAGPNGEFDLIVRKSSSVEVTAFHPLGGSVSRVITSGGSTTMMPPMPGSCEDKGTWKITKGKYQDSQGVSVDCSTVSNPYVGTCVEGMGKIFECFDPEGACTYDVSVGKISYENGATSTVSGMKGTYTGPNGENCGSYEIDISDQTHVKTKFSNASGDTWVLETTQAGDQSITCPSGEKITITAEQSKMISACSGQGQTEDCEVVSSGGGSDGGGIPKSCKKTEDCPDGQVCCPDAGGPGVGFCLPDYPGICG